MISTVTVREGTEVILEIYFIVFTVPIRKLIKFELIAHNCTWLEGNLGRKTFLIGMFGMVLILHTAIIKETNIHTKQICSA